MPELIAKADLLDDIELAELDAIAGNDDAIIDVAIDKAEANGKNWIRHKYDVAVLFVKAGAARDTDLVQALVSIALFNVSTRLSPNSIPENRMINNDLALKFFKDIRTGLLTPTWDKLVPAEGNQTVFGFNDKSDIIY